MKTALAIFNAALSGRGPFAVATITINCEAMWTWRPAEANALNARFVSGESCEPKRR
jgi:hypothetical protein